MLEKIFKFVTLRSPLGGNPIRNWTLDTYNKGPSNIDLLEAPEQPVITPQSYYCIKIGYLADGSPALIKDAEAHKLYVLFKKHFKD